MTVRVLNLGSGSSGNSLLIADGRASVLVDCGVGARTISAGLREFGLTWDTLDAVLISHEHVDHVKSLPTAVRRNASLFCTDGTAAATRLASGAYRPIDEASSPVKGLVVTPILTSHDAEEPCGFNITMGETRICVITDTGEALDHFVAPIRASDLLVLEANHDLNMLWNGPYPYHLKRRVASATGHLSNAAAGELLRVALAGAGRTPEIWLGHLSETNNRPATAVRTVREELLSLGATFRITAMERWGNQRWNSDLISRKQLTLLD